ncbi:hypothetical protein [uncultured Phycicoccus sp.]|nr:hypothetical protein [uncultured Phycicoccus sp.]
MSRALSTGIAGGQDSEVLGDVRDETAAPGAPVLPSRPGLRTGSERVAA